MNAPVPATVHYVAAETRPNLVAGNKMAAIIPTSMDEAYRMAKAVCMAGMAPKGMDTPERAMIAIMRGLEVGLTPFQALDKIAVVNGRPTIWGDGAMGLVRGSGICEWVRETISGEGDRMVATCEAKRRGDPESILRTFSVADAKQAGLWGKSGPWQQFPKRMLGMRARAFCLRDGFADVLGGLYLREELEDTPARDVTPARQEPPRPPQTALQPPRPPVPPKPQALPPAVKPAQQPAEPGIDWHAELEGYDNTLSVCEAETSLNEVISDYSGVFADAPEAVRQEADKLVAVARQRLERQEA